MKAKRDERRAGGKINFFINYEINGLFNGEMTNGRMPRGGIISCRAFHLIKTNSKRTGHIRGGWHHVRRRSMRKSCAPYWGPTYDAAREPANHCQLCNTFIYLFMNNLAVLSIFSASIVLKGNYFLKTFLLVANEE